MSDHNSSPASSSSEACRIKRLSDKVINRIAAGEVIHRPANALKELLENSLDAGSTQITITVGQGGLKLLQIQDNGKGIHKDDLEIVCERFTTSKLQRFEDLKQIKSFGFRGEALASISHVAHVSIISKTTDQPCAYKAHYRDGKLIPKRPGGSKDPVPCAGKNGTNIIVEDLFYNLSTRKQALKNTSEQYQRILDVVQKYAVHFGASNVGFVCKKQRDCSCDINTLQHTSQLQVIRTLYGSKLAAELVALECSKGDITKQNANDASDHVSFNTLQCKIKGYISNPNYNIKKSQFILFINHRLVENTSLKRASEEVYGRYLPKHTHPFIYLSLEMPPQNVDVNVHPTKREVHFLHEEQLCEFVVQNLEKKLQGTNESRTFTVQPITNMLTLSQKRKEEEEEEEEEKKKEKETRDEQEEKDDDEQEEEVNSSSQEDTTVSSSQTVTAIDLDLSQSGLLSTKKKKKNVSSKAPNRLVRTDHRSNTIDKYFYLSSQRSLIGSASSQESTLSSSTGQCSSSLIKDPHAHQHLKRSSSLSHQEAKQQEEEETEEEEEEEVSYEEEEEEEEKETKNQEIDKEEEEEESVGSSTRKRPYAAISCDRSSTIVIDMSQSQDQDEIEKEVEPDEEREQKFSSPPPPLSSSSSSSFQQRQEEVVVEEEEEESIIETTQTPMSLTSIQNLLQEIQTKKSKHLTKLFRQHTFVGVVNESYSLIQYRTKLYVVRHQMIGYHVFYQRVVQHFGSLSCIQFKNPFEIEKLVLFALENPIFGYKEEEDGSREQFAKEIKNLLISNGPMLAEYFSLDIDQNGFLRTIPRLLPDHLPPMHGLPEFIFQLATDVNWEEEQPCFENIAQVLAKWYSTPSAGINDAHEEEEDKTSYTTKESSQNKDALMLEHVLFPATKNATFCAPNALNDASFVAPVACLTNLYKIFERC